MLSRIPSFGVKLADLKNGLMTREWYRFFTDLLTLAPVVLLKTTATLDFPNTLANAVSDLTVTVTGAVSGDGVTLGVPAASVPAGGSYSAWVSAPDVVTVRFTNSTAVAQNPASGSFLVVVTRY